MNPDNWINSKLLPFLASTYTLLFVSLAGVAYTGLPSAVNPTHLYLNVLSLLELVIAIYAGRFESLPAFFG